jgi:hypothetical protein
VINEEVCEPVHDSAPEGWVQVSGGLLEPVTVQLVALATFHEMTVDLPVATSDGARLKVTTFGAEGRVQVLPVHPYWQVCTGLVLIAQFELS